MPYKTKAEIIKTIREKFGNEEFLGKDKNGAGFYSPTNTVNGCGCIIGCLLPIKLADKLDSEYRQYPIIEDLYHYWKRQIIKDETLAELFTSVFTFEQYNLKFLSNIQTIHDSSSTVEEMLERLNNVPV
jgi:hypothetical protein